MKVEFEFNGEKVKIEAPATVISDFVLMARNAMENCGHYKEYKQVEDYRFYMNAILNGMVGDN